MRADDQDFVWSDDYSKEASDLLEKHFGNQPSRWFPSMRVDYRSKKLMPEVEHRTVLKNNTEYHGLENYAWQYHASGNYRLAYEYFLMAAAWRADNDTYIASVTGAVDDGHAAAVEFCLRQAVFNKALSERVGGPWPIPEDFGIDPEQHAARENRAQTVLDEVALKVLAAAAQNGTR